MSQLHLRIFDGTRQPFPLPAQFLVTIMDGYKKTQIRDTYAQNDILFDLPFFDNYGDQYTVIVWAKGYKQGGYYPVILSSSQPRTLDIMLIPHAPGFNFADAGWPVVKAAYPFLASDVDDATGQQRYGDLLDDTPAALACFLNLTEAMSQISFAPTTPLDYIKQVIWTGTQAPAQDRFFAWCDVKIIPLIQAATTNHKFSVEKDPGLLHPGATRSWKQVQFGEANVQLTFHETNKTVLAGIDCCILELDMDYYADPLAHALLEVLPNELTHMLTDPTMVYQLRWIAGRSGKIPEFAPLYTIV